MRLFLAACLFLGLASAASAQDGPQPPLPHSTLVIDTPRGAVHLNVELATDETSRMRGLMFRTKLAPNDGMLFDFQDEHFRSFWMKNTILPLDMLFIRGDGTISSIAAHTTPYSEKNVNSREPVRAVLEINAGRSAALGLAAGEKAHNAIFSDALPGQ